MLQSCMPSFALVLGDIPVTSDASDGKGNQLTNNVIVVWSREMQVGMAVAKPQKL